MKINNANRIILYGKSIWNAMMLNPTNKANLVNGCRACKVVFAGEYAIFFIALLDSPVCNPRTHSPATN